MDSGNTFPKGEGKKLTFHELFLEWIDYKTPLAENQNTISRYKQRYRKYLENSCLHNEKAREQNPPTKWGRPMQAFWTPMAYRLTASESS